MKTHQRTGSTAQPSPARPAAPGRSGTRPPASSRPRSTSPRSRRSTPPSPRPPRPFPAWRATSLSRRAEVMFHFRELVDAQPQGDRRARSRPSTARCSPTRSARSPAASRTSSSPAASRTCSRAASASRRRPASTSTRSASRSASSPASRRSTSRRWCRCGCSPTPSPAATRSSSSRREKDPSASLFLAELLQQAGLPDGVFNVVQGDKVAVDRLLEHPDIAAVSFVGSTPIARYVYETGTAHGKRVQALGGAKNHMVVLPDADIDMAADAAVSRRLRLGRRAVHGHLGRRRRRRRRPTRWSTRSQARLAQARASARAPSPTARWARSSPASTATRSPATSTTRPREGATRRGRRPRRRRPTGDGFFLGVSLLDDVSPAWTCYNDEIFGPVLGVVRVDTYDEALRLVNDNPYGNGTAIFTRDGGAARQFQFEVRLRHGRRQRADPGAGGVLQLRRLEGVAVRRHRTCTAPTASHFYTRTKVVTSPLARPGDLARSTSASRRTALTELEQMDFGVVLQTNPPAWRVVELAQPGRAARLQPRVDVRLPPAVAGAVRHLQPDPGGDPHR